MFTYEPGYCYRLQIKPLATDLFGISGIIIWVNHSENVICATANKIYIK